RLAGHFVSGGVLDCEYRVRTANGDFNWIHERSAVTLSSGGLPSRLVGLLRLVTARKEREAQLEYLANYDDLTGHYNKLRLREALEHALAQALRYGHPSAFLMVGVDQLGMINGAYGSDVGDAVLVEIARQLDRCLRNSDIIGRPGGDRFGIILSNSDLAGAKTTADRILALFRDRPIEVGPHRLTVSVSIGAVAFPLQARSSVDVMSKAESAMLEAKAQGRDGQRSFTMDDAQQEDRRLAMAIGETVKTALRENRLTLAYQPVVDARSHDIAYHECLVRMRDKDGVLVPASRFIPVVEQLGLMRTIDRHVLRLAIDTLERLDDCVLAINISGVTAADHAWLRVFISHLKGRPALAKRLIVEITETAALQDIEETARFVATIRALGCKVALDDFGAGYTTFRHMKALTVDVVKIDGSFVKGIAQSAENQMFIRNLLSLARTLDLSIVAECVETLEDAQFLADEGVDLLQGYYFGKPALEVEKDGTAAAGLQTAV
ncbi:MAG TPA: EAL domain-containing protein, partial [Kiloniellaceae bacterium]|nr:EAL domain-containing protein [Kiloniellaceae bacterium]